MAGLHYLAGRDCVPSAHHLNYRNIMPEFVQYIFLNVHTVSEKKMGPIILVALAAHDTTNFIYVIETSYIFMG